jgi:hypothetical protein
MQDWRNRLRWVMLVRDERPGMSVHLLIRQRHNSTPTPFVTPRELLEKVETFQNMLVSYATGGGGDDLEYRVLREELMAESTLADVLPRFVRTCRDLPQFWAYIKTKFVHYQERRQFLWDEFRPALEKFEKQAQQPGQEEVSETLVRFDQASVHSVWTRALDRRTTDPEGAITLARTLLETVCKHILDASGVQYADEADLPKLYRLTATKLNLAPDQPSEQVFKQVLGGCSAVVEGLGAVRNKLSDSHGKGKAAVKPSARHAQLAVNLAGAMATFLVESFEARKGAA